MVGRSNGMITNADKTILDSTLKNSKMAIQAIQTVINRVEDEELAYELNCEADKYKKIGQKALRKLKDSHVEIQEDSLPQKVMLKSSIQAKTMINNNTERIADMMIQGSTKGITDLTKVLNQNKSASRTVCEIANELVAFEENNIERLKTYL